MRRRADVFVMDFFCSEITQNVSFFFFLEHEGKEADMCGDRWKHQTLVLFLIYTFVLTTSLASKEDVANYLSIPVLFSDVYLTILNNTALF